jgi:predicted dienelactone hydrolase
MRTNVMKYARLFAAIALVAPVAAHAAAPQICEAQWRDPVRGGRAVPVRIRMPAGTGKVPLVLFSHGLGGSLDSGTDWAEAWAAVGLAVINLQHPGSDRGILRDGGLFAAMSPKQLQARVEDVHFVIDEVGRRPREGACDLSRIDLGRIGMSGHSFGAITTQAIAGQHFAMPAAADWGDKRVTAAIAFSPSPPMLGDDGAAFGALGIPFFSVTGTADAASITPNVSAADRQRPYRAMPAGGKYLLVLDGANHMEFNGQDTLRNGMKPDPHIRAVTIAATTAFWRATLMDDAAVRRWLAAPDGLRAMLKPSDLLADK